MGVVAKRSSMIFYSGGRDHYSHRVRVVLAEKGVTVEIVDVEDDNKPEDLADLNPYNSLPTLIDRDLVLYESRVMMEYLDERFPHPPLLPVYPVARAQSRLMAYRIERDWCGLVDTLMANTASDEVLESARNELYNGLTTIAPIFKEKDFFMSDDFTLVDCCVVPILWRLPIMEIELNPRQAKPLLDYMDRMFARESFQTSLSEVEVEMRE